MKLPNLNPEMLRNLRAQLRPNRLVAAATICAALSLVVGFAQKRIAEKAHTEWAFSFLREVLVVQFFVLTIGGGVACLNAIHRERDTNTLDFQRVTRLTPLELAVGKLFGAPATAYFVTLCFMPAALVGARVSHVRPSFVVAGYLVLLLGSIAFHSFTLTVSLFIEKGSNWAAVLLVILLAWLGSFQPWGDAFLLRTLSPVFAYELVQQSTWRVSGNWHDPRSLSPMADAFFGYPIHHFFILVALYVTLFAWLLLALARNIKRDPTTYELYSPWQSFCFAVYLNFILVGFFKWDYFTPLDAQATLLSLNIGIFIVLGVALLRNRDQLRRRIKELGDSASGWLEATWPAKHLLAGTLLIGLVVVGIIQREREAKSEWYVGLAIFRTVFFALWLLRDILYLQWANLRTTRRPLAMGFLYLMVFYVCVNLLFGTLGYFAAVQKLPLTAIFVPSPVFVLDAKLWGAERGPWILALFSQAILAGLFVHLQRQRIRQLLPRRAAVQTTNARS